MVLAYSETRTVTMFLLMMFVLLISPSRSQTRCRFPSFLQQDRGSLWTAAHYRGYFKAEIFQATTISDDATTSIEYEETCLEKQDDKYIVEYRRKDRDEPEFFCKQFIKHTNTVIQIRYSDKYKHKSPNLCDEKNMRLDHWPLVNFNSEFSKRKVTCPFSGGYNMKVYDPNFLEDYFLCDTQVIRPRLQSDCQEGEGITIDFKHRNCMHKNLNMGSDIVQHFDCLAHWVNGKYTFIIIRPSSGEYKAWCLRLTNPLQDLREGHLFLEFVCDPGVNGKIEAKIPYLRISFVKLVISSICADGSVDCESRWCELELRSHCSQKCGDCSGETDVCPFKESTYGSWIESEDSATKVVNISVYDLYLSGFGTFHCLETKRKDYENRTVLWQIFDNGCFPRFRCLEMEKISSSVMQYRLSKTVEWPISPNTRPESAVCHSDQFKYSRQVSRNTNIPMKVIIHEGATYSVHCNLPKKFGFSNNGVYISNDYCNRCISYSHDVSPTIISDTLISCSSLGHHPQLIKHECLASIDIDGDTRAVLTKQRHHRHHKHTYDCWVFTIQNKRKTIFLLDATECNVDAIQNIMGESLKVDGRYNVYENETDKCPYIRHIAPITTTEHIPPHILVYTETEPTPNVIQPPRNVPSIGIDAGNGSSFVHIDFNMLIVLIALSFLR